MSRGGAARSATERPRKRAVLAVSITAFQYLSKKKERQKFDLIVQVDEEQVSNYAVASVANRSQSLSLGRSCDDCDVIANRSQSRSHNALNIHEGTLKLKKLALQRGAA